MGVVVAARDARSGARVAVKTILPQHTANEEFTARFMREAQAGATITSERIARVFEIGTTLDGSPFMAMELLEGASVDKVLRARGPLPFAEAADYVIQACEAIAEAHARGFIHRDLKPSNLFLAERPGGGAILKVLDFGISKRMRLDDARGETPTLTATDSALGSPTYMSPEQFRDAKRVDHRTDIWSLGLILHRMIAGRPAFEADSAGAHLAMIVSEPPAPLRKHRPDAPAALEEVVSRCLQRDLARRYQNVGQLVLALAPFAPPSSQPIIARVIATVGREAADASALAPLIDREATTIARPAGRPQPAISELPARISTPGTPMAAWTPDTRAPKPAGSLKVAAAAAIALGTLAAVLVVPRLSGPAAKSAPLAASALVTESAPVTASALVTASATAAASAPAEISVQVSIQPPGATLELDGAPLRETRFKLPRDGASHTLVARAPGYVEEARDVVANTDAAIAIALRRAPAGASHRTTGAPPPALAPAPAPEPPQAPRPEAKKPKGPMETSL
jgi:serine/threonine-protein kinase